MRFELNLADGDKLSKFIIKLPGYSPMETYLNDNMAIKLIAEKRIMLGGISTISLNRSPLYLIRAGNKSSTIEASKLGELSPDWKDRNTERYKGYGRVRRKRHQPGHINRNQKSVQEKDQVFKLNTTR